jgi:uncharacterized protein YxeA
MTLREKIILSIKILSMIMLIIGLMLFYHRNLQTFAYLTRPNYEGKLIDKSLTIRETKQGSMVSRRFLLEEKDGVRFEIAPSADDYERAQIGTWIKSSKSGVIMLPSAPTPLMEDEKK